MENDELTKKKKGVWIPAEIAEREDLKWLEKVFISEVRSFYINGQDCYKSNAAFAKTLFISTSRFREMLAKLIERGFITATYNPNRLLTVTLPENKQGDGKRSPCQKTNTLPENGQGGDGKQAGGMPENGQGGDGKRSPINKDNNKDNNKIKVKRAKKDIKVKFSKEDCLNLDLPFSSENFKNAWREWIDHKDSIKKLYKTEVGVKKALAQCKKYKEAYVIELINRAIISGWQGFIFRETPKDYEKWLEAYNQKQALAKARADKHGYVGGNTRVKSEALDNEIKQQLKKVAFDLSKNVIPLSDALRRLDALFMIASNIEVEIVRKDAVRAINSAKQDIKEKYNIK